MLTMRVSPNTKNRKNILDCIPISYLLSMSLAVALVNLVTVSSLTSVVAFSCWIILALAIYSCVEIGGFMFLQRAQSFIQERGIWWCLGFLILGVFWLDWTVEPSSAAFLTKAEEGLKTVLSVSTDDADITSLITLLFNILRALLIIYIAVSIVKVVNASREDDDWKQMARFPLIVVVGVMVADVLAEMILP